MLNVVHGLVVQLLIWLDRIGGIRRLINRFLLMEYYLGSALTGRHQR